MQSRETCQTSTNGVESIVYAIIAFEGIDGAGKTSLIKSVQDHLSRHCAVTNDRLANEIVKVFKTIVDVPAGLEGEYQNRIPDEFRLAAYIFESVAQMKLKHSIYDGFDVVLFDRWIYTNIVYLPEIRWNADYFRLMLEHIPKPNLTFYLDVDVDLAMERLAEKDDWMLRRFSKEAVKKRLTYFHGKFEGFLKEHPNVIRIDGRNNVSSLTQNVLTKIFEMGIVTQKTV